MGKVFYTERDIEDMVQRGERSLVVNDDVVELLQPNDTPPAAPTRPYINKSSPAPKPAAPQLQTSLKIEAIRANVKSAVRARMGSQVSDELIDRIIDRVAAELGLK
jgi:hypothetical protein